MIFHPEKLIEASPYWGPFLFALWLILRYMDRWVHLLGFDLRQSVDGLNSSVQGLSGKIERLLGLEGLINGDKKP